MERRTHPWRANNEVAVPVRLANPAVGAPPLHGDAGPAIVAAAEASYNRINRGTARRQPLIIEMKKSRSGNKWWLFGLPALICLPCIVPALVAGFLAVGGGGAVGSFVGGVAGPVALTVGIVLFAASGVVYLTRRRWRQQKRQQSPTR